MPSFARILKSDLENVRDLRKTAEGADLTEGEKGYLAGVLFNHMGHYSKNVTDNILQSDLDLYNKLSNEQLTIEEIRSKLT